MATYLMQFSFTQQGIETVKDLLARAEAAKNVIRQAGGEVQAYYALLGSQYDTMFVLNAPNEEKVAQMALGIARSGNVRTQTHRLFNEDEIKRIISSLP
jgi:uncharacterized protein with GYD domain